MRNKLSDIIRYKINNIMAKGTISLVGILFAVTFAIVVLAGLLSFLTDGGTAAGNIWTSVMHVIDPGTITGDETGDFSFRILMSIVTLCGIFITSILISIITTGFQERLDSLKRGAGRIIEKNHTLILGYNQNTHTVLSELIKANANQKDACVVILADSNIDEIQTQIDEHIQDFGSLRVIYRSGDTTNAHMLYQCSIDTCKSVIINADQDYTVIATVLAINNFLVAYPGVTVNAHVVTTVNSSANYEAIRIAGKGYIEPILFDNTISKIIAQTCRQPGLSNVLIEIFNYTGNEIYIEKFPSLTGKSFGDTLNMFENAVVFGIKRGEEILLNPDKDVVVAENDLLIIFAEDDNATKPLSAMPQIADCTSIISAETMQPTPENILILGTNDLLDNILMELDDYFVKGSKITIADTDIDKTIQKAQRQLNNMQLETIVCDSSSRENIEKLLNDDIDHVLLLGRDDCEPNQSDSMTLLKLIHLRDIMQKNNKYFNIASELKNTKNQKLANVAKVNDLVVGGNIINLMAAQIAENRDLAEIFNEILQSEGSEIYLKNAGDYIKTGVEADFYTITEIVKQRNEIALGYKLQNGDQYTIVTNPPKSDKVTLSNTDHIIVLSKD